jgi:alpha-L-rhamnosidase
MEPAMTEITRITCFDTNALLGVARENILLSWEISAQRRDVTQHQYQLQLAIRADFSSICYDSGWIGSAQSVNVALPAFIPSSCQRYWYRVRIIDDRQEQTDWSPSGWFETALLTSREWKANWVTPESEDEPAESVSYLHRMFDIEKPLVSARVYATALGIYQLTVNKHALETDLFSPGWTSYDDHLQFQVWDLTPHLKQGENALIVALAEGWFKGELSWLKKRELYGNKKAFLGQIHLRFADGEERVVFTDSQWRCSTGPVVKSGFYSGEVFDARRPDPAQHLCDEMKNGPPAKELKMQYRLVPQISEPVRITESLKPVSVLHDPDGVRILDLGQNMVGRLRVQTCLDDGQMLTLRHGEVLDQAGKLYTDNLRNALQTVQITGNGQNIDYAPVFSFQGFRYVSVEGLDALTDEQLISCITGEVLHTDMMRSGDFNCDNPLINQLYQNILWGQRGNFVDVPTDCPQRDERLGWTGDAHIFIRTGATNYNVRRFFRKWLMSVSADQKANGTIPMVVPDILREYISKIWGDETYTSSGWGDAAVICPWTLWQMYGDRQLLAEQYPGMKAWVQYIHQTGADPWLWNSGFQFGDWLALDAEPDSYFGATPVFLVATAFYAWSVSLLSRAAEALGFAEDAALYGGWAENVSERFRQVFMLNGDMMADTQTAHILPLAFGLLPEEQRQSVADRLHQLVRENDYHLTTGFLGTPWLCTVLSAHGHHETAVKLACQRTFPSWLFSVDQGATTIWEHWDGIKPDGSFWSANMNSYNHYAYGAIGEWLFRYIAGLDYSETSVAWDDIVFRPDLSGAGFRQASAHYNSVRGRVAIDWRLNNGSAEIKVKVPANAKAIIILPEGENVIFEKNNHNSWKDIHDNHVRYIRLGSGNYHFMIEDELFGSNNSADLISEF